MSVIEEVVSSGTSTSAVDPRTVGDFLAPEREYLTKVAGAIDEVVCRTERHEHGVTYSVLLRLAPEVPYDDQPECSSYEIWQRFVRFGSTDAAHHRLRVAAQDQEAIGAYAWRAMDVAQRGDL